MKICHITAKANRSSFLIKLGSLIDVCLARIANDDHRIKVAFKRNRSDVNR